MFRFEQATVLDNNRTPDVQQAIAHLSAISTLNPGLGWVQWKRALDDLMLTSLYEPPQNVTIVPYLVHAVAQSSFDPYALFSFMKFKGIPKGDEHYRSCLELVLGTINRTLDFVS